MKAPFLLLPTDMSASGIVVSGLVSLVMSLPWFPAAAEGGEIAGASESVRTTSTVRERRRTKIEIPPSRYFANVPVEFDPTTFQFSFSHQDVSRDSNLLALHFDFFGIPWKKLARGSKVPAAWARKIRHTSAVMADLKLPVYLALTPIASSRDRLASNARGVRTLKLDADFSEQCEDVGTRSDYEDIRNSYDAYVDYMVEQFAPSFVAISIEINLYAAQCPEQWAGMKRLLNEVYASQKAKRPQLALFHTFHVETLWQATNPDDPCFGFNTDCVERNLAALADLQTDLFAVSTYPMPTMVMNGGQLPPNWLSIFSEKLGKPVAIAETGFQAFPLSIMTEEDHCLEAFPSSTEAQAWWMSMILHDAERLSMPFVVWWGNHDLIPQRAAVPCACTADDAWCDFFALLNPADRLLFRFFGTIGLRDHNGTARPALDLWVAAMRAAEQ